MCTKVGVDILNGTYRKTKAHCNLFSIKKVEQSHNCPLHVRRDLLTTNHVCNTQLDEQIMREKGKIMREKGLD
jgi:hypothetical protein